MLPLSCRSCYSFIWVFICIISHIVTPGETGHIFQLQTLQAFIMSTLTEICVTHPFSCVTTTPSSSEPDKFHKMLVMQVTFHVMAIIHPILTFWLLLFFYINTDSSVNNYLLQQFYNLMTCSVKT